MLPTDNKILDAPDNANRLLRAPALPKAELSARQGSILRELEPARRYAAEDLARVAYSSPVGCGPPFENANY